MNHFTTDSFWESYYRLPTEIRKIADKNYELLKNNPLHPSLHLKKIKTNYSVRIGLQFRALGISIEEGILWFWIGNHSDYEELIK